MKLAMLLFLWQASPVNIKAYDTPNDAGGSITITWELDSSWVVSRIEIYRTQDLNAPDTLIETLFKPETQFQDIGVMDKKPYYYRVLIYHGDTLVAEGRTTEPAISTQQWFNSRRLSVLIILLIYTAFLLYFIMRARVDKNLFIRKIAGLEAIDEAVGRSTEMGRPILYIMGLGYISDIPTVASLAILKRVAYKAAEYEADVIVPCYDPIVMVAAQETVKEGYIEAGRPDLYKESNIYFLTSDQFGYAAGVDGIMMRQRPGAVLLQGYFYAESLILAETGHSIGAIQISGTTAVTQLPFFIASTDYTLIGEEMYAASAYLSRDALSLGTIKGEDYIKMVLVIIILIGSLMETFGIGNHMLINFFNIF
uniref:DUF6754 domain-containing protein n=1 Tax=candidate division WOR-3 bacterium TaxID=2052148 RepID=A0A7V3KMC3_UNCW3